MTTETPAEDTTEAVEAEQGAPVEAEPQDAQPEQPEQDPAPEAEAPEAPAAEADPQIKKLRREAAKYRTERNDLETKMNTIIDGLKGLTGDKAEEQTPEQAIEALTAERDTASQQLAQMRTDSALTAAATSAGADAELLTLVLKGKGALTDLDPNTDDFQAQVAELVTAEVAANPKLKATPAVPQSSGSTPEDSASPRAGQLTRDDMKNMSPKEINDAVREGRFRDVLGG